MIGELLEATVQAMPAAFSSQQATAYEARLAAYFDMPHAIAVSSGTAALHCALAAAGIGPGDEVCLPAACVVMSAVPVLYTGATPVFIDSPAQGFGMDLDDLTTKITPATRAVLPVHLWGRTGNLEDVCALADERGLLVIEDACQAVGSRSDGRLAGTLGQIGCFSTKDGKILHSGEGGFLVTSDETLADRCRALRTHWQTPPADSAPMAELGYNYRLAEPLAAIARVHLDDLDNRIAHRQQQSELLLSLLAGTVGVSCYEHDPWEEHNGYAPVIRVELDQPRRFCQHLADCGVPNSLGTYGLHAADQRSLFAAYASTASCRQAADLLDHSLAVVVDEHTSEAQLRQWATTITREARQWAHR